MSQRKDNVKANTGLARAVRASTDPGSNQDAYAAGYHLAAIIDNSSVATSRPTT